MDAENVPKMLSAKQPQARERRKRSARAMCRLEVSSRHEGLLRLKEWVETNGALMITLKEAAEIACLEPHHFSKAFRKYVGVNFREWRRRERIAWAVTAIRTGALPLADVVHQSGYRDRRAFERAVKCLLGTTPGGVQANVDASD